MVAKAITIDGVSFAPLPTIMDASIVCGVLLQSLYLLILAEGLFPIKVYVPLST